MDTFILLTADAASTAQSFIDTIAAFLPFPWDCVVSGIGSAIVAVFGWHKLTKTKKDAPESDA